MDFKFQNNLISIPCLIQFFIFINLPGWLWKKRDTWPTVVLTGDLVIYKRVYQCKLKTCPMPAPTPVQTVQLSWSSLGAIDDHGMCVSSSFCWNNGRIDQALPLKDCSSNCPWHWKTLQKFALHGNLNDPVAEILLADTRKFVWTVRIETPGSLHLYLASILRFSAPWCRFSPLGWAPQGAFRLFFATCIAYLPLWVYSVGHSLPVFLLWLIWPGNGLWFMWGKKRTGLVTTPGSEFLKGVKTDSLFLEEYFLSKPNVNHSYLISLEFRSTQ